MQKKLSFIEIIKQYIESGKVVLPVFSSAAMRIQQEMVKKEPAMRVIENVTAGDQALSSLVLKMANSSFYRGLVDISTVRAAIVRLGMQEVGRITLIAATQKQFKSKNKHLNLVMKRLWQHSVGCALASRWLAKECKYGELENHAFFSGLFHDVGKLFILMVIDHLKSKNKSIKITNPLLMEAMSSLHTEQGYNLMKQWNMPEDYCVITRDHHRHDIDHRNQLLLLVRMADLACIKLGIGVREDSSLVLSVTEEAKLLNISEIHLAELEIFLEDTKMLSS